MHIQRGSKSDIEAMKKLFYDTITAVNVRDYEKAQIEEWRSTGKNKKRWEDLMEEQLVWVAKEEGNLLGFASLKDGNYLDFMYVHKDHQKQGIASQLYDAVEKEAHGFGSSDISSDVSITAKDFFLRRGFVVDAEQIQRRGGVEIKNFKMHKKL